MVNIVMHSSRCNSFLMGFIFVIFVYFCCTGLVTAMTVDPHQNWLALGTSLGYHLIWDMRFQLPIRQWQHTGHGGASKCVHLCVYLFVCRCMCVCMFMHVWASNTKWLEHRPANQKVAGLLPIDAILVLFLWAETTHIAPVNPVV